MGLLRGSKTHENLRRGFAGEAQTRLRYQYFAITADIEGHHELAHLFRGLAELSAQQVDGQLDLLRKVGDPVTGMPVGDTEHNLSSITDSELKDSTDLYPAMAQTALREGFPDIADWFATLAKAKQCYVRWLQASRKDLFEQPAPGDDGRADPQSRTR